MRLEGSNPQTAVRPTGPTLNAQRTLLARDAILRFFWTTSNRTLNTEFPGFRSLQSLLFPKTVLIWLFYGNELFEDELVIQPQII